MHWRRSAAEERGSAVVDFVLVIIVLIPIVLGIAQVGLVVHVRNTLTAAASDGARAGSPWGAGPEDAVRRARELVGTALADRFAEHISARDTAVDGMPTIEVVISARVPALGLFGPSVALRVDGHAVKEVIP